MLIYIMYIFILIIFLIIITHIIINKFSNNKKNKILFKKKVNSKKMGVSPFLKEDEKTIFPEYSENITENKINEKEDLLDNIETNLLQDLMLDN